MNSDLIQEYRRLRQYFAGKQALSYARINLAFHILERRGLVRLCLEPEIDFYDDSYVDTWDISEAKKERIKKDLVRRINREGHWILVSYYLSQKGYWETAESIGGFIGRDWENSGYDSDVKLAAIVAAGIESTKEISI